MEFILNGLVFRQTIFENYYITCDGIIALIRFNKYGALKSFLRFEHEITKNGYHRVEIKNRHYLIHRLVFQAWGTEELDNEKVIDHIDANPDNNHISNLRQVTQKENINNSIQHGNFGHNHDTKIKVLNTETYEIKYYDSIKQFLIAINAPEYMINHGGLSTLKKRSEYNKYKVYKIDKH